MEEHHLDWQDESLPDNLRVLLARLVVDCADRLHGISLPNGLRLLCEDLGMVSFGEKAQSQKLH